MILKTHRTMKRILIIMQLFIVTGLVYSQEQLSHPKKMYTSDDGKFYINKHLPVYLWLSTSPNENAEKKRLYSDDSKKYTNPLYFDTEGFNSIRTPSKVDTVSKKVVYPIEDIIFEVYSDGIAPISKHKFENVRPFVKNNISYIKGETQISIKSKDGMSGIEKIYYSLNNSPYTEYKDPLIIDKAGEYTLKYYAVDNVGNVENTKEIKFSVDKDAPKTSMTIEGDNHNNVFSSRTRIVLATEDNLSGVKAIRYKINNSTEQVYSSKINVGTLSEGEHIITYYSEDNIGNKENEQKLTFFVDKTPPILIDELLGDSYIVAGKEYMSGRAKVKLTAMDNKAGVKSIFFSTNGKDFEEYKEPFYLPSQKGGNAKISYYAIDNVNNKSASDGTSSNSSRSAYMDLTGPSLNHKFNGKTFIKFDTIYISQETKIVLSAWDSESGLKKITYSINNDKEEEYKAPFSISKPGINTISFTGHDNVNNTNTKTIEVYLDDNGPEIFYRFSSPYINKTNGIAQYPPQTYLFLSATDDIGFDKINYSINNAPATTYTGYIKNLQKNTDYNIKISAYDKIGNISNEEVKFRIVE